MKNILVIEDNDDSYALLVSLLKELGFQTDAISRCILLSEVLHYSKQVDIVLTDIVLPDSSRITTFSEVFKKFHNIPILVLTGSDDIDVAVKTIKQGAQDYLIKGELDRKTLGKAIQYAVERKKLLNDYRRTFMESPAPMYIFEDDTFRFLDVNNAALHQYGYSREEFIAMTATAIRPSEDIAAFVEASKDVPDTYNDFGRWRHIKKNGEVFFVHVYAHKTEFEGKSARSILAIDIDQKVRTEKALEEKVAEIENILESIADGFFTVNSQWEFTYINKVSEEKLKAKREELLGKSIWEYFPEAQSMLFYSEYNKAMADKVSVHFEEYYYQLDIWVSVNAYPTNNGLAVYFIDITEQKKIQEKIFNDEQNLRAIINNTSDIIWSIDATYNIITANEAFWNRVYKITGVEKNELTPEHFEKIRLEKWKEYFDRALSGEAFKMIWTDIYDGAEVFEEVSFNPIRDKQNSVIGISCFSRDITKQRMHLNMIEKQNQQLKEIAWIQSHEVRGPVASIMGLTLLFNKKDKSDAINSEIIDKVEIAAKKLDEVIKKIMANTRV